jgi:hypothetical protein
MTTIGIINDEESTVVIDEYQAIIDAADRHGLKVIVVGSAHNMGCEMMRKIIDSERFEIVQQRPVGWVRPTRDSRCGDGPRDKWGRLK